MIQPVEVLVALGSNLDDPLQQLRQACREIEGLPRTELLACSAFYRSTPMGPVEQDDFINAVARLQTRLSPLALLDELQALEQAHHRVREVHWGPRTLDLDILLYGDVMISEPRLSIPHPGLGERNFVLYPLRDVVGGDYCLPDGRKLDDALQQVSPQGLTRLDLE